MAVEARAAAELVGARAPAAWATAEPLAVATVEVAKEVAMQAVPREVAVQEAAVRAVEEQAEVAKVGAVLEAAAVLTGDHSNQVAATVGVGTVAVAPAVAGGEVVARGLEEKVAAERAVVV